MTTIARAAVLHGTNTPFAFEDIVLDDIRPTEVLVKIVATGLCHTDLSVVHGDFPSRFPTVLGHEGSGIVEEIGAAVTDVAVGDHVAISFASCGHCAACLTGHETSCAKFLLLNAGGTREDGTGTMTATDGGPMQGSFFGQSSFASHAIVAARNVVTIAKDVPLEIVGPLGCGFQTGAGTILNSLEVTAGSSVIVSGTGAVGLAAIMGAKIAGATTIIAVDILDQRLEVAQKHGATHVINGKEHDVTATILEITGGLGAAYAVDTTAVPSVIENVINGTSLGAKIALIGVSKPGAVLPLGLISGAGKTLVGALEGDSIPQVFIPQLVALYRAGVFPFDDLVTTYPFDQIEAAIEDTRSGATVKAVLTMP